MNGIKKVKHLLYSVTLGLTLLSSGDSMVVMSIPVHAQITSYTPVAYDISEFQGQLTQQQVLNLKREIKFVILRVQDGLYHDRQVNHNIYLMRKYGVPYGVYSFSRYTNSAQAAAEASRLHRLAPNAKFYVNDFETGYTRSKEYAAVAWANRMKSLSNGRPVVLYASKYMLDAFQPSTLNSYNNIWLADYTNYMPNPRYQYDLWQYTDSYHSNALGERLDADVIPIGGKSSYYWTKNRGYKRRPAKRRVVRRRPVVKKTNYRRRYTRKYQRIAYKPKKTRYYNLKRCRTYKRRYIAKKPVRTNYRRSYQYRRRYPTRRRTRYQNLTYIHRYYNRWAHRYYWA